jgi:hypothetical protein
MFLVKEKNSHYTEDFCDQMCGVSFLTKQWTQLKCHSILMQLRDISHNPQTAHTAKTNHK